MRSSTHISFGLLCVGLMFLWFPSSARAQNVGVQAIGLEKFSVQDTDVLAGQLASVHRPVELAVLPFEFRGASFANTVAVGFEDPVFANTKRLATYVLENNHSTFTLSIHLYFAHGGDAQPKFRYEAFKRSPSGSLVNNSSDDVSFRNEIRARALRTAAFLNALWSWANSKGIVQRLVLVTIPELEDSAATPQQWLDCRRFIEETYAASGAITRYRRSVHGGNPSRASELPIEKHGPLRAVSSLRAGDTYSNDGIDIRFGNLQSKTNDSMSLQSFISSATLGVRSGKSVLYWRSAFNGPRDGRPYARATLRPFTDARYGADEQTALWIYLNSY